MAVFYTAASLSGAFSGLLAFGIEKMDGIAGRYIQRIFGTCTTTDVSILSGRSGWQWMCVPLFTDSPAITDISPASSSKDLSLWPYLL